MARGVIDDAAVYDLAARAGLQADWVDAHGRPQRVAVASLRSLLGAMGLSCGTNDDLQASRALLVRRLTHATPEAIIVGRAGAPVALPTSAAGHCLLRPEGDGRAPSAVHPVATDKGAILRAPMDPGYYGLHLPDGQTLRLALVPSGADSLYRQMATRRARLWGVMAQVYSLRMTAPDPVSATWGHGDFAAVRKLARRLAYHGADALALSPLHAMFSADPTACSPYCPSNRLFWNTAYAAPADVLGPEAVRAVLADMPDIDWAALEGPDVIDWARASRVRMRVLRRLHDRFSRQDDAIQRDYRRFVQHHGDALTDHALFESLHASHARLSCEPRPWPSWDVPWRDPRSPQVQHYAATREQDVDFHRFLQWLTLGSLKKAQDAARQAGMRIGLMGDMAVGASPFGSQAWSRPDHFLQGVSIGAPPDIHYPQGQVWGLTAFSPHALLLEGYAPFLAVLRASLAHTGGLRIDHILGFQRLWIVPEGAPASEGAYLRMPARALLGLTALEAWLRGRLVIGENLGTVPDGFNACLRAYGIAGMNVLWFQRAESKSGTSPAFLPPRRWSRDAVAMTSTHDLPTLKGWWAGVDIMQRNKAGLLGADSSPDALLSTRRRDRFLLWRSLGGVGPAPRLAPLSALLAHVASAPCGLMLASMEDLAGMSAAPNVPGTVDEFPNWRSRLPCHSLQKLNATARRKRLRAIRRGRRSS